MKKADAVNRYFGDGCAETSKQRQDDKIKEIFSDAAAKNRAKKELNALVKQFHGQKTILQLLPVIARRCSKDVLRLAIERVEGGKHELHGDDLVLVEEIKALLREQ